MLEPLSQGRSSVTTSKAVIDHGIPLSSFFDRPIALQSGYFALAMVLLLEWAVFMQFYQRELAWAYPTSHDQTVYLSQSYETYDHILNEGLLPGLRYGWKMVVPQGKMMHLQAALLLLVAGPNRLTALSINFFYFALLQCFAFYTLFWLTKRWSVAFLGLGLLLATHSRFLIAGGIADFRLDHIALCLFGVFVCLVVRSCVFALRGWSVAAALAGALLILFRYQSAVTLSASLGALLIILSLVAWRSVDVQAKLAAQVRIRGLLLAGVLIAIVILPALWPTRREVIRYYAGQVVPDTKIWAQAFGASTPFRYWNFYVHSLAVDHLGILFCELALGMLVVVFIASWWGRGAVERIEAAFDPDLRIILLFISVMFFVPLLVLTFWPVRNPVVGNILVTPAIGLFLNAVVALAGRGNRKYPKTVSRTLAAVAASVFIFGVYFELSMATRGTYLTTERTSVADVLRLYDDITALTRKMGWASPSISIDRVGDYLGAPLASALSYERHGVIVHLTPLLGNDIVAVPLAAAVQAVEDSDFAIITDVDSPQAIGFLYPFAISMQAIQPQLHAAAERSMTAVDHFQVFTHRFTLYMRPSVQVLGDSGGWITSQGLTLVAPAETFRERPNIVFSGITMLAEHLGKVSMKAEIVTNDGKTTDVPAEFELATPPNQTEQYKAAIHLNSAKIIANGDVKVKLSFDKFFVPKEFGFNVDTRQLVLMTPKQFKLLP